MTGPQRIKSYLDSIDGDEKFLMCMGAGVVDTALLWFDKLDASNYVILTMGTIGAFIGAKAYQEVQNTKSEERITISTQDSDPSLAPNPDSSLKLSKTPE